MPMHEVVIGTLADGPRYRKQADKQKAGRYTESRPIYMKAEKMPRPHTPSTVMPMHC